MTGSRAPSQSTSGSDAAAIDEREKKKLRNRLSQRAFRRRQAEALRELQSRVKAGQQSESETIAALQRENRKLRAQLVEVHAKMSRLLSTMQMLTGSVSKILDESPESEVEVVSGDDDEDEDTLRGVYEQDVPQMPLETIGDERFLQLDSIDESRLQNPQLGRELLEISLPSTSLLLDTSPLPTTNLPQQIPNIWSFEYQMGPQPYINAVAANQHSSLVLGQAWTDTNSPFSDHIQVLQDLLKVKLDQMSFTAENYSRNLYQSISIVLSMFNSITRPDVMIWYAKTRFYHIIELTAWTMYPSMATFEKLHHRYRPTAIQGRIPHPRVIDWIPFPSIRDKLIQLHAANPQIDQIFVDAVTGYVVETLLSDLVLNAPPIKAYIRVTDLITSMQSSNSSSSSSTLPAPSAAALFSPSFARLVFRTLNMDRGASYYKIDPAFFGKYPELYDSAADIAATGIPLKPEVQICLSYPKPLDPVMHGTYRSFIDFSLNAVMETYPL